MYYSFVEHHRLKCRVNVLMQNYDKNPKTEPNIQSLTKQKSVQLNELHRFVYCCLLLFIILTSPPQSRRPGCCHLTWAPEDRPAGRRSRHPGLRRAEDLPADTSWRWRPASPG